MAAADLRIHPELPARVISVHGLQIREDSVFTDDRGRERKSICKTAYNCVGRCSVGRVVRRVCLSSPSLSN